VSEWKRLRAEVRALLCTLLRDIFGNPSHPVSVDPAWLTWKDGTIPKMAQVIYEDRDLPSGHLDNARLAVLADALEDAGCTDADILGHCRQAGVHVRGCWVVDLILGKGVGPGSHAPARAGRGFGPLLGARTSRPKGRNY
jgi:hypothetical protein